MAVLVEVERASASAACCGLLLLQMRVNPRSKENYPALGQALIEALPMLEKTQF
jgi:hypothetical protein